MRLKLQLSISASLPSSDITIISSSSDVNFMFSMLSITSPAIRNQVPALQNKDEQLLLKICDSLSPVYYNEPSDIVREGDPIDAMFIITDGVAWSYSTSNNGEAISGSSSLAERLERGDFFGGELLEFVLKNPSLPALAISPRTVKTHGPIEGFAIMAEDLKNVVTENWEWVGKGQLEPFASSSAPARRK
ncbi:cyclic nucleotide-gated ion channel 1 [Quercus suber]|uniref:Cyclic nucleotide-gated ion channel 1 n=1 Tax=Quercus suber TaxID=58331 RepID=A0AAW0LS86_QUESU